MKTKSYLKKRGSDYSVDVFVVDGKESNPSLSDMTFKKVLIDQAQIHN